MLRKIFFWTATYCSSMILLEALVSVILIHSYRLGAHSIENERSQFSLVNAVHLIASRVGLLELDDQTVFEFKKTTKPETFNVADDSLGYASKPSEYQRIYQRKRLKDKNWESLKVKVTINPDGSRWTGGVQPGLEAKVSDQPNARKKTIYIYGDSFVFGIGVNDEHTFSYLTQQALPNHQVKLFALGGYSLTQSLINFEKHKSKLLPGDIVVLGYADFYNERNVLAPSHLQAKQRWFAKHNPDLLGRNFLLPRVLVNNKGAPYVDYIYENCEFNGGHCDHPPPSKAEMAKTSASIINYINSQTNADIYVLHLRGKEKDPMFSLLDDQVNVIQATDEDFDYFIRDNIEGFDEHPGPYWHYAISRRLIEAIKSSNVTASNN